MGWSDAEVHVDELRRRAPAITPVAGLVHEKADGLVRGTGQADAIAVHAGRPADGRDHRRVPLAAPDEPRNPDVDPRRSDDHPTMVLEDLCRLCVDRPIGESATGTARRS